MWLSVSWVLHPFEMSYTCDPYFSCCGWREGFSCDHWWLFSLLWLLYLGHMCFDLLCWFSGLCLSWGWCLVCFTLASEGVWPFALRNLVVWLLSSWDGNWCCHPYGLIWGGWCFYLIYCIFCFSLPFSSYPPKSLCFTCYTSMYLLNYVYHCARMSSNEM
jgi:hypothetical protein